MVTRKPLRSLLTAIGLFGSLLIGYFWVNAYTGPNGLNARQDLLRIAQLNAELATLKAERSRWERRVSLLQPESTIPTCWTSGPGHFSTMSSQRPTLQVARP
jgi:hypothetical protein